VERDEVDEEEGRVAKDGRLNGLTWEGATADMVSKG
jgi:hypothetical protein